MAVKVKKILGITFLAFLFKVLLEVIMQWSNLIPNKVKGHIWGKFDLSVYYIKYDFLFHIWFYLIAVILLFLLIDRLKIKTKFISFGIIISILAAVTVLHNFQVPFKNYYSNTEVKWNFQFLEQVLVYSLTGVFTVYMIARCFYKRKNN